MKGCSTLHKEIHRKYLAGKDFDKYGMHHIELCLQIFFIGEVKIIDMLLKGRKTYDVPRGKY